MNVRSCLVLVALATSIGWPAATQARDPSPRPYSLGTSTQGSEPAQPAAARFGPLPPEAANASANPYAGDEQLLASVSAAFAADPALRGAHIDLAVRDGRVILSGTALDAEQAAYARGIAVGVAGAERVEGAILQQ